MFCSMIFFCLDLNFCSLMGSGGVLLSLFMVFLYILICKMKMVDYMGIKIFFSGDLVSSFKSVGSLVYMRDFMTGLVFLMILLFNLLSLMPWVFSVPSLGQFTVMWALMMWLVSVIGSLYDFFFFFFVHLVPSGVPMGLSIFMIFIEFISLMIRPVTLSVRLVANVSVGHLMMSLGGMVSTVVVSFVSLYIFMFLLELLTAFMQAYVFVLLSWVYVQECD